MATNPKITQKQIEETVETIAGSGALPIYKLLKGKIDVNEFDLVEKLNLPINQIRNSLYKFDNKGLLASKRKKDRKKGWYIYFWTLDMDKLKRLALSLREDRINFLQSKLDELNADEFYVCEHGCSRMDTHDALDSGYICPVCGGMLGLEDSKKVINKIKREINLRKKELGIKNN
jgi:transcription initiation factor TFIIE subunit alpha